jgi:peptidoglycan/xylan/chitin deacetylase (PgdA/CDA1 family)
MAGAGALVGCSGVHAPRSTAAPSASPPPPVALPRPTPPVVAPPAPVLARVPAPHGNITSLPEGSGNHLAWTVDDGADSAVVAAYAEFAKKTGTRLTFFLNGHYSSWADNAAVLRPLVASGQVQLGNHTFTHADLTTLSDQGIIDELARNDEFIQRTFGVSSAPFYRPPYGYIDQRVRDAAARAGFTTPVLWYGSLSDSGRIASDQIVEFANSWFLPGHIVIGHANFDPVTQVFPQLDAILRKRQLQTVTLNDVYTH